ncbi:MAG: hypothetical protein MUD06_12985 [Rhodospirillales bacterium]|nr:hypothetical protein [Rhodospirillales bacterium]
MAYSRRPLVSPSQSTLARSERQGGVGADLALAEAHQIEAAAAQVAEHAVRLGDAVDQADGGEPSLLGAAQHVDGDAAGGLDPADELAAVTGVADRGGADQLQVAHVHGLRQSDEAHQAAHCLGGALGVQPAALAEAQAQRALAFLVENRDRQTVGHIVDYQPHRVGADVDDADARR